MSERYPKIRLHDDDGLLKLREGLLLCFFMRHSQEELSSAVVRTLNIYLDAVGPEKLGWYLDMRGEYNPEENKDVTAEMRPLDGPGWAKARADLSDPIGCVLQLDEHPNQAGGFRFEYYGRQRGTLDAPSQSGIMSAVSCWLPMEYLEEQGPARVRRLAVEMARELPLASGYVSPAFNYLARSRDVIRFVHEHCFIYPGMDIPDLSHTSMTLGLNAMGAYWLNFYGQPLLGRLGGMTHLRERLDLPLISVEDVGQEKALVSLGERPEIGGTPQQESMRPYRALACVLEPFLHEERSRRWFGFSREQLQRWQRRFL